MGMNPLMLIVFIIVFLISFPAPVKVQKTNNDSFPALVKVQKTTNDSFLAPVKFQTTDNEWRFENRPGAKGPPLSWACKEEHENCIYKYIYGNIPPPHYTDPCCETLRSAVPCLCRYIVHSDNNLSKNAFYFVEGCGWRLPPCPIIPMPKVCQPEVRDCVDRCIYGGITPPPGGLCCQRFRHAKHCVCSFVNFGDKFWLAKNAKDAIRGCRFTNPKCPPPKKVKV